MWGLGAAGYDSLFVSLGAGLVSVAHTADDSAGRPVAKMPHDDDVPDAGDEDGVVIQCANSYNTPKTAANAYSWPQDEFSAGTNG